MLSPVLLCHWLGARLCYFQLDRNDLFDASSQFSFMGIWNILYQLTKVHYSVYWHPWKDRRNTNPKLSYQLPKFGKEVKKMRKNTVCFTQTPNTRGLGPFFWASIHLLITLCKTVPSPLVIGILYWRLFCTVPLIFCVSNGIFVTTIINFLLNFHSIILSYYLSMH